MRCFERGVARLNRWRTAAAAAVGPDAADVIDRVRQHLADDLNTPKHSTPSTHGVPMWRRESVGRRRRRKKSRQPSTHCSESRCAE